MCPDGDSKQGNSDSNPQSLQVSTEGLKHIICVAYVAGVIHSIKFMH